MAVPWLQIVDAVVGVANFARSRRAAATAAPTEELHQQQQMENAARAPGGLEARMAGVVVAGSSWSASSWRRNASVRSGRCGWSCSVKLRIERSAACGCSPSSPSRDGW